MPNGITYRRQWLPRIKSLVCYGIRGVADWALRAYKLALANYNLYLLSLR